MQNSNILFSIWTWKSFAMYLLWDHETTDQSNLQDLNSILKDKSYTGSLTSKREIRNTRI